MSLYVLDTNILSELVRQPQGPLTDRIAREGEGNICTSIVVAAELRFGACKKSSTRLTQNVESILSAIDILSLEEPADRAYGELRTLLEAKGETIGPNDMLIAAHVLSLDGVLVTANNREFSRVPGLRVENWLTDPAR